jgi:hypothetical protein
MPPFFLSSLWQSAQYCSTIDDSGAASDALRSLVVAAGSPKTSGTHTRRQMPAAICLFSKTGNLGCIDGEIRLKLAILSPSRLKSTIAGWAVLTTENAESTEGSQEDARYAAGMI